MAKTQDEIRNEFVDIRINFQEAQNEFTSALRNYEKQVKKMVLNATTFLYEVENTDGIAPHTLTMVAQFVKELQVLEGRFNGLKCELT